MVETESAPAWGVNPENTLNTTPFSFLLHASKAQQERGLWGRAWVSGQHSSPAITWSELSTGALSLQGCCEE